jgi:hypothetical protein
MVDFNFADRKLNKQQQEAYINGWEAMTEEVKQLGWVAARDKFNLDNPPLDLKRNLTLNGYAYACGGLDYLLKSKP